MKPAVVKSLMFFGWFTLRCLATQGTDLIEGGTPPVQEQVYVLGPQDQIVIRVIDFEEIADKPIRIDPGGFIELPLIGRIHAAGMTVPQLRDELLPRLKEYVKAPELTVNVVEFHSQPISVLGAVNAPGVHQIEGPRHLMEVLSAAGGLRADAGSQLTIARQKACGPLPFPNARTRLPGEVSVADLRLDDLMKATNPAENILICANDTITVSTAELIYVIGEVKKPGGFTLHSKESVSVLQALSLAEGLEKTAAPKQARILRAVEEGKPRIEIPANLRDILTGKAPDLQLQASDILVVPNNAARNLAIRTAETALQIGTGIVIFHR